MAEVRTDEGRRVLRNAVTIGAFLMSPITLMLMFRALGAAGYGRWWWTFVLLEAAGIIGNFGTDLWIRREIPQHDDDAAIPEVVGTALVVVIIVGSLFAGAQLALAGPIASLQGDGDLAPFLAILAFQPLLWNLGAAMGAALQSRHRLGALAAIRGLVFPIINNAMLFAAWRMELPIRTTLILMLAISVLGVIVTAVLYARHFDLGATVRSALHPRRIGTAVRYGSVLFAPMVLFTIGGKIDLYVMGAYVGPAAVGLYAACLQMSSGVPNTRALFDPIAQAQIGSLHGRENSALGLSLRRLARLCTFALAPAFVATVAVGEPVLGWLIGHRAPEVFAPLAILAIGHLVAGIALAAWLVPMMFAGRLLTVIAAVSLIAKVALLFLLVPRYGAVGAAIATVVGGLIAMHAQAWTGSRRIASPPYTANVLPIVLGTLAVAALGRLLFDTLVDGMSELAAVVIAGGASALALLPVLFLLLDRRERADLRGLFGGRAPS